MTPMLVMVLLGVHELRLEEDVDGVVDVAVDGVVAQASFPPAGGGRRRRAGVVGVIKLFSALIAK